MCVCVCVQTKILDLELDYTVILRKPYFSYNWVMIDFDTYSRYIFEEVTHQISSTSVLLELWMKESCLSI